MYYYKRIINSGPLKEVEYIKSVRERNKRTVARNKKICKTSEQQKKANKIRAIKNTQRKIACNFSAGDAFARFSAPKHTFTESEFREEIRRFFDRIKYHAKKQGKKFKYIGYIECGKLGKNWHMHIILNRDIFKIAWKQWKWKNGINDTPLYADGCFWDLAKYIHKDIAGEKRLMTSRNLTKPDIKVYECRKKRFDRLGRGQVVDKVPNGYVFIKDDVPVDDWLGCSYSFTYWNDDIFYNKGKKNEKNTS